jgi:hypothetical protein
MSSEQALSYHLNKKYKCGTWKCINCHQCFDTKFQLQMHEMSCYNDREPTPSYDNLRLLYLKSPIIYIEVENDTIISVSPGFKNLLKMPESILIGKNLNYMTTSDGNTVCRKNSKGELIYLTRTMINANMMIEIPI